MEFSKPVAKHTSTSKAGNRPFNPEISDDLGSVSVKEHQESKQIPAAKASVTVGVNKFIFAQPGNACC